jgi:PAP2 superfamily
MSELSARTAEGFSHASARAKDISKWSLEHIHLLVTILLTLALVPLLHLNHLPVRIAWADMSEIYWMTFVFQGAFAAILLYILGFSPKETVGSILGRLRVDWRRTLLLIPFLLILYLLCLALASALVWPFLAVFSLAVVEWFDRTQGQGLLRSSPVVTAAAPAALYLFWGLILVSGYNDIAVASRPNVTFDAAFNRIDSWLLHGTTVSVLAHSAVHALPGWFYKAVEFVYYFCMFPQIGAALLLLAFRCGRQETLRFTIALLTAYYLAIGIFWLWPTQGPYFICSNHFADLPSSLATREVQRTLSNKVASLWTGRGIGVVGLDYYIAFPSMHIGIPTIVAIFLKRWKRVFYMLLVIDALILASVILLAWHYILDVIGGLVVAAVVTVLVPPRSHDSFNGTCEEGQAVTNSSAAVA